MSAEPWYRDGLQFECTRCGNCCTGAPGYVWLNDEEIAALAKRVSLSEADFLAKYVKRVGRRQSLIEYPNGDCIFYDRAKGCTVYEDRPRQCRTWPFWDSNLKTVEAWAETCDHCPGAGKGPVYSAEEIVARSKVIRI